MFKNTKYTTLYFKLIEKYGEAKYDPSFHEKHHILPKSLGGSNETDNIVNVHPRVHFILHKLLPKIVSTEKDKQKMNYALWRMMNPQSKKHQRKYRITAKAYERYRLIQKQVMLENNPMKNPEISKKFRKKRPEQSAIATKRNIKYWTERKLPMIAFRCEMCGEVFETTNTNRICCSKSCAATYRNKMRRLG